MLPAAITIDSWQSVLILAIFALILIILFFFSSGRYKDFLGTTSKHVDSIGGANWIKFRHDVDQIVEGEARLISESTLSGTGQVASPTGSGPGLTSIPPVVKQQVSAAASAIVSRGLDEELFTRIGQYSSTAVFDGIRLIIEREIRMAAERCGYNAADSIDDFIRQFVLDGKLTRPDATLLNTIRSAGLAVQRLERPEATQNIPDVPDLREAAKSAIRVGNTMVVKLSSLC